MTIIYSSKELRPRQDRDFYPTPYEFAIEAVRQIPISNYLTTCLDPGCGDGVWSKAVKDVYPFVNTIGIDINPVDRYILQGVDRFFLRDYLTFESEDLPEIDLIIGNPPYKLAEQFLDKSFELIGNHGYIVFLLRSAFAESKKRYIKYFSAYRNPVYIYQSVSRLNFYPEMKGSGDTAYSLFVWKKNYRDFTEFRWLDWKK